MHKKNIFSFLLVSILIFSFVISSVVVSAQDGGTTVYLPAILKTSTLTIGTPVLSFKLSPFFADTGYDMDVANLTQLNLLTIDRQGMVVENAIAGETRLYNGTSYTYTGPADVDIDIDTSTGNTLYTFTLRPDMKFADGLPVSADDLIFTLYTFLDPSYDGTNEFATLPILGLQSYRTQTTPEIYEKYENLYTPIYDSGKDHIWSPSDPWTQAQQTDVWNRLDDALVIEVEKIVNYVVYNYADGYAEALLGFSPEEVYANEGLQVAFGMRTWGFAEVNITTKLMTANHSGRTWNLNNEYPTLADYANEIMLAYDDDYRAAFPNESADGTDIYSEVKEDFILYWGTLDPDMIGGIPNISGIQKIDETTVTIEVHGFASGWIYSFGLPITPLHYYGSTDKYDYAQNKFGFEFGDLSLQHSKTSAPMGAGPYQYASIQGDAVYLGANIYYYKVEPKINQIEFIGLSNASFVDAIGSGRIDLAELSYNQSRLAEIYAINSNGKITGDVVTTSKTDNLGYGYTGINARLVKVGDDPSSIASRNFRKALSTILAINRKPAVEAYYGLDGALVPEYPTIPTSWASPQPNDPGYHEAFSLDVNGEPIYSPGMSQAQKVAAAKQAALAYFAAAGFTVSGGKVVAAPSGAKLKYEIIVPGGGTGDHPSFGIITLACETFSEIGFTLTINDPVDANDLWDALETGTQELWIAAWGATIDPDLFQVYHSSNTFDQPYSSESNHYYLQDPTLDALIMQARSSDDQALRKQLYQQAFDIIMDWGVEIPTYSRQNYTIFSSQRINTSTITQDITVFWGWMNDIENMTMK